MSLKDSGLSPMKGQKCVGGCVIEGGGVSKNGCEACRGSRNISPGSLGCRVFLSAERVLAVVDGVSQFLQHDVQRRVLRQLHHEHTRLHPDVARVRLTCRGERRDRVSQQNQHWSFSPNSKKADEITSSVSVNKLGERSW